MNRMKSVYSELVPDLQKSLDLDNVMQVPRIEKVVAKRWMQRWAISCW
jgi:hypothetical protein